MGRVLMGLALGGVLLSWTWVYLTIDREVVERRVNRMLASSPEFSDYRFEAGAVDFDLITRSFEVRQILLIPRDKSGEIDEDRQTPKAPLAGIRMHRLRLEKISLLSFLVGDMYRLGRLLLDGLHIETYCCGASQEKAGAPDSVETSLRAIQERIVASAPAVRFGSIELQDAHLSILRRDADSSEYARVDGISAIFEDVEISRDAAAEPARLFFGRTLEFEIDRLSRLSNNRLYWIEARSLSGATETQTLELDSLKFWPIVDDAQFQRRITHWKDRYRYAMAGVRLTGFAFRSLAEAQGIISRGVVIDSVYLDIFKDKRLPAPAPGKSPPGPQEAFRKLGLPVNIDTFRVESGIVSYSEINSDGAYPGRVWFDEVNVEATRLCSDPENDACRAPAMITAEADFMGRGRLQTTFEIPLLSQTYDFGYRGRLGPMPAARINEILTNLTGLRIERGQVDGLSFDIRVHDGVATGGLDLAYHDLEMEFVDKVDRNKSLIDRVKTFVVYDLMTHPDNDATNEDFRHSEIEYVWSEDPFFRFVWHGLREGILDTLKK